MDHTQKLQEEEYSFPYHHVVDIEPFSQSKQMWWGYKYAAYIQLILTKLGEQEWKSLIDIGCGDGKLTHEIHARFSDRRIVGTDYSQKSLRFAQAFSPTIEFAARTEEIFDAFVLVEVLEHIPLPQVASFLQSIDANLAPGGFGIVTVPSTNLALNPKHYQHFSDKGLRETLGKQFVVESVEYLSAPAPIIARLLINRFFTLTYRPLTSFLYTWYTRNRLHADATNGQQLIALVRKK